MTTGTAPKRIAISCESPHGSDFDGISSKLEFGDFGGMGMVVDALAKSFSSADVDKICHGNALRVFEEVIG